MSDEQQDQLKEIHASKSRGDTYYRANGQSARRVAEALVIAALIGLGGSVWLLRESVAVLQTSQAFLQRQIEKIDERQDRTAERVNEMSGRVMRGLQEGKDPLYAPDKQ